MKEILHTPVTTKKTAEGQGLIHPRAEHACGVVDEIRGLLAQTPPGLGMEHDQIKKRGGAALRRAWNQKIRQAAERCRGETPDF